MEGPTHKIREGSGAGIDLFFRNCLTYDILDFASFNFKSECVPAVKEEEFIFIESAYSIAGDSIAIAVTYLFFFKIA